MRRIARSTLQTAINLVFFAAIGTAILASVFYMTHDAVVKGEEGEKLNLITQIVPPTLFDNDIIQDTVKVTANELLGTDGVTTAYRARLKGEPSAVVLESVAPDGYSGKITLILAVRASGELTGVRVISHKETPGLGDYIDLPKSPWIKGFDGKSREVYKDADWKVRKTAVNSTIWQVHHYATCRDQSRAQGVNYFGENHDKLFVPGELTEGDRANEPSGIQRYLSQWHLETEYRRGTTARHVPHPGGQQLGSKWRQPRLGNCRRHGTEWRSRRAHP